MTQPPAAGGDDNALPCYPLAPPAPMPGRVGFAERRGPVVTCWKLTARKLQNLRKIACKVSRQIICKVTAPRGLKAGPRFGRWLAFGKCRQAVPAVTIFAASRISLGRARRGTGNSSAKSPLEQQPVIVRTLWTVQNSRRPSLEGDVLTLDRTWSLDDTWPLDRSSVPSKPTPPTYRPMNGKLSHKNIRRSRRTVNQRKT